MASIVSDDTVNGIGICYVDDTVNDDEDSPVDGGVVYVYVYREVDVGVEEGLSVYRGEEGEVDEEGVGELSVYRDVEGIEDGGRGIVPDITDCSYILDCPYITDCPLQSDCKHWTAPAILRGQRHI